MEMLLLNKLDNLKIKHKLFIVYFLLIFINVLMVSIIAYYISFTFIKEQSISILSQVQKQKELEIHNNLQECESISQVLLHDPKIQKFIAVNYFDRIDEIDALQLYVDPVLKSVLSSRKDGIYLSITRYSADSLEVIGNNFEYILSKRFAGYDLVDTNSKFYHILNLDRMERYDWFSRLHGKMSKFRWMQIGMDKEYDNISLVGEMRDEFKGTLVYTGMIRVCVSIEKVLAEGETINDIEGCVNFIFDESGTLFTGDHGKKDIYSQYASDFDGMLQQKAGTYKFIGNKVFLSGKMKNNWTIVSVVPVVSVYKAASNIKYWFIILDLIIIVLLLLIAYFITNSFTKRLNNVTGMMQKFKKGNFDVQIVDNSSDELGFLSTVFNDMVRRIKVLIRDNYQSNIDKKDAQLKVLQEQIKPHMLYNSLSTISRLAERQDTNNIKKMVKALCQFYRLSLNKGSDYLSIFDEFEHLKAYLDVFSIRHKNSFRVCYKIDQAIYGYDTVKVLLQPFVENIFEHSVYDPEKPITIVIEGKSEGDDILFTIIDDGLGMRKDILATLLSEGGKGYGIRNVDDRIKIHFGDSYGVRIFSVYGGGTAVEVRIPKLKHGSKQKSIEGGEQNAQFINRG
jgi:two-component system, sensor histidine kinase YesM